ncbi:MAG: AMP-binding protein [Candidatus Limnocylindrales bacterium]
MERDSAPNRPVTTATPPTHAAASWFGAVSERVPPERPAIVFRDRRVSWGELRERVSSVAGVLSGSGLGRPREADEVPPLGSPHDHIGLMLENGPEYIEAFLGASAARALAFSVNTRYTATETADLLRRMDARALVFSGRLAPVVAAALRWPGTKCRSATSPWAASSASSAASPTIDGHGSVRPANHL